MAHGYGAVRGADWKDRPIEQSELNAARGHVVLESQRLVTETIFNKTYPAVNLGDNTDAFVYSKSLKGLIRGSNTNFVSFEKAYMS